VELLHEAAFGETSPLGSSKYAQNLDRLDTQHVLGYRATHFLADNIIVAASGISHDKLKSLVDKYVGDIKQCTASQTHTNVELQVSPIPTPKSPTICPLDAPSPYVGGIAKLRLDLDGVSHTGLAFPIPTGASVRPYLVLNGLLSEKFGDNSMSLNHYSNGGLISFYTSGSASTVGSNLKAVIEFLQNVAKGSVDVIAAANKVSLNHFISLEGGDDTVKAMLTAHLNSVPLDSFGDVRAVRKEDVVAAAVKILKTAPSYAVLGTTAYTPTYAEILSWWN